ncbi:MAG: threonine synthase [Verrucomicrobia bacterium 21-51-4]|nr:MAG: threonine synthase [Verrucomicrobia bacterium 21-51-4]HQU08805.1 threonine synthase [Opitutales bacterium]
MRYLSTRGLTPSATFSQTVAQGLAPDGGLYVPETLPFIGDRLLEWSALGYEALVYEFLQLFADDVPANRLRLLEEHAYERFPHPNPAPLKQLSPELFVLELFHGPTFAFKDFPLQLLGNLYEEQIERTGQPIHVLGATSGDTGSAAICGLQGKKGVATFILYPKGRIAELQERQMTTTGASNVFPIAIDGTYDDAHRIVKALFNDRPFCERMRLSAVNSINVVRLFAQAVYYLWAWFQLPEEARRQVQFVVPSGNSGNVIAGWWLERMGLPVHSWRLATNQNDLLYRLLTTGTFEPGSVLPSRAPSMDIQMASNFERFVYYHEDQNPERVRNIMDTIQRTGRYHFDNFRPMGLVGSRCTDAMIVERIRETYDRYGYIIDPHTACGMQDLDLTKTSVVLATAHPAKFPNTVQDAIGITPTLPELEALKNKPSKRFELPADVEAVRAFIEQNEHVYG